MSEIRVKMGEDGRVVIPAAYRHQLHLEAGEELIFRLDEDDEELRVTTLRHSLKKAQEIVKKYAKNESLVKKLLRARKEEAKHE